MSGFPGSLRLVLSISVAVGMGLSTIQPAGAQLIDPDDPFRSLVSYQNTALSPDANGVGDVIFAVDDNAVRISILELLLNDFGLENCEVACEIPDFFTDPDFDANQLGFDFGIDGENIGDIFIDEDGFLVIERAPGADPFSTFTYTFVNPETGETVEVNSVVAYGTLNPDFDPAAFDPADEATAPFDTAVLAQILATIPPTPETVLGLSTLLVTPALSPVFNPGFDPEFALSIAPVLSPIGGTVTRVIDEATGVAVVNIKPGPVILATLPTTIVVSADGETTVTGVTFEDGTVGSPS